MKAFERQAGVAAIWVVIVILFMLGSVVWGVFAYIQYEDVRARQVRLQDQINQVQEETRKLAGRLPGLVEGTGFSQKENSLPTQEAVQWIQKHKYGGQADEVFFPLHGSDPAVQATISAAFEQDVRDTTLYHNPEELAHLALVGTTLYKYQNDFYMYRKQMIEKHPGIIDEQFKAVGFSEDKPEIKNRVLRKIGEVRQKMQQKNSEYEQRRTAIEQQLEAIRDKSESERRRHERQKQLIEKKIQEQRNIFEDLLRTKHPVFWKLNWRAVHGRLVEPDLRQQHAWINIGSRHRVVPGLRFLVAVRGARNTFHYKGEVEVRRVFLTSAEVEIRAVFDPDRPLIDGDILVNPLFNKHRPLKIAFAGAEKPPGHEFSITEAKRRIIEFNNIVQDKVDVDTDFLIWTDFKVNYTEEEEGDVQPPQEYPENWWTAAMIGIPIAPAMELYKFMGD